MTAPLEHCPRCGGTGHSPETCKWPLLGPTEAFVVLFNDIFKLTDASGRKTMTTEKKPHPHADLIKQWADNPALKIEWRNHGHTDWAACIDSPSWIERYEYRVKPEPPAKVYPETRMTWSERVNAAGLVDVTEDWDERFIAIANAALRHAIDTGSLFDKAMLEGLCASAYDAGSKEARRSVTVTLDFARAARDMAVAEAVRIACKAALHGYGGDRVDALDLQSVIDGVGK